MPFHLTVLLSLLLPAAPESPIEIGDHKQLFIDQQVYWKGNSDVASLLGKPIRMHVKMTRGKLFAFQFTPK